MVKPSIVYVKNISLVLNRWRQELTAEDKIKSLSKRKDYWLNKGPIKEPQEVDAYEIYLIGGIKRFGDWMPGIREMEVPVMFRFLKWETRNPISITEIRKVWVVETCFRYSLLFIHSAQGTLKKRCPDWGLIQVSGVWWEK